MRNVLLLGLGTFGGQVAVARWFLGRGARVTVTDKKPREKLESSVRELEAHPGVRFELGVDPTEALLDGQDLVVRSPAVVPGHALLVRAAARGIPVTTEIALTLSQLRVPYVGVTGTKGKSTTTALLGAILREAGRTVHVGGNIGRPLLESVASFGPGDAVVLELSSFMGEELALARAAGQSFPAPRVLVVTSLAPEHLDRHGTKDAYYEAKLSLVDGMGPDAAVVYSREGELGELLPRRVAVARERQGGPRLVPVALEGGEGPLALRGDEVVWTATGGRAFRASSLRLEGRHNVQNAALAVAAAAALGELPADALERAVAGFEALPHRLQTVARDERGRVYVNDSIATTPESAGAALEAFAAKGPVVLLLGGSDKGSDFSGLAREVARKADAVICFGALGPALAGLVRDAARGLAKGASVVETRTLEEAFEEARARCPAGGAVLLSPGCASYDQFRNFEERGDRFAALARRGVPGA